MHPVEIKNVIDSMTILIDTREQASDRAEKRYKSFLCSSRRQKLDFGDYSAEFEIDGLVYQLNVAIERKMNLDELAMCFTHERKRFTAEFERAKKENASMYLLVEDANWENLINGRYRSKFNSFAFLGSLTAWMVRYNCKLIFCKSETSGILIREILKRELKERLEAGEYDQS